MRSSTIVIFLVALLSGSASASRNSSLSKLGEGMADRQMLGTQKDTEVTRRIRESLVKDENLSLKAQNISIVTMGKDVMLKGTLEKQGELGRVLDLAKTAAPGKTIKHELTVEQ